MFIIIYKKKGWYFILLDILMGIVMIIQELVYFGFYDYYGGFNLRWFGLFMLFNSLMYFIISYLHTHDGKLFKYGVRMGMIWGIVSCILCLIFKSIISSIRNNVNCKLFQDSWCCGCYRSDYYNLMIQFNFMTCYTWFISLSSLLLYFFNKPSKKLPIKPSSSV